jgi:hypothetical protein
MRSCRVDHVCKAKRKSGVITTVVRLTTDRQRTRAREYKMASIPLDEQFDIPTMVDPSVFDHLSLLNDPSPPSSTDSSSSQADSPPDWSQFSNLWDNEQPTFQPSIMKFDPAVLNMALNLPLNMDIDFNPSLAVDPSALHFDPKMFANTDLSSFPPQPQVAFPQNLTPRRMSITSSSSSGGPFSPVLDPTVTTATPSIPSPAVTSTNIASATHAPIITSVNDPVDELAHSVREAAGVTLAVPVQGQAEHLTFSSMGYSLAYIPITLLTATN